MNNKYTFIKSDLDKFIDLPIELKWDFYGRDDSIDVFEEDVIEDIIGLPDDFEILRFAHKGNWESTGITAVYYNFNFFNNQPYEPQKPNVSVLTSSPSDWVCSYLPEGFTTSEVYYYTKPFTKSFFKLDFYDSNSGTNQTNYFTVILPVDQGFTENVVLSSLLTNVNIKIPSQKLDYVGDKEGFFFYWLRKKEFLNIDTFYMSAKFFDARLGVYVKMTNVPQSVLPDKFVFDGSDKFYYKVILDYTDMTYKIYDIPTGQETSTINWFEYINP